jgi:hypothetical protein
MSLGLHSALFSVVSQSKEILLDLRMNAEPQQLMHKVRE